MKIHVGVTSLEEVEYFLSHGASEVYCGFSGIDSHQEGSFNDLAQIYEAIRIAHGFNKKFFLAVNETYHPHQYPFIVKYLEKLIRHGLDGVIIKDISLSAHLNQIGLKVQFNLSSLAQCFNLQALEFYSRYNISRVVIPQHMLAKEARDLVLNKLNIETEIFYIPVYYCANVDGLCNCHGLRRYTPSRLCKVKWDVGAEDFLMPKPPAAFQLASLYDFYRLGVAHLKISRQPSDRKAMWSQEKKADFQKVMELLLLLKTKGMTRAQFVKKALR